MEKEYWNYENLHFSNSEEFKYLDKIDEISDLIYELSSKVDKIDRNEHYKIQNNKEKIMIDFTEIRSKLNEIQKLVDKL